MLPVPDAPSAPDPLWTVIRAEAWSSVDAEPLLAGFLHATILKHRALDEALGFHLAGKLATDTLPATLLSELFAEACAADQEIGAALRSDLQAVRERDPASHGYSAPLLYFKGFHALEAYRVAHWLWNAGRATLALYLQNRISEVFGVDIHPAARIGRGVMIDHGTGVVIGETAVVEDNVSLLHEVTLGGTGKETGDRHPKVRQGVLIGAGAKVLGNIEIGAGSKVGAGSVVLDPVPPHRTVAGVPAKIVGRPEVAEPALDMDQQFPHAFDDGGGI